MERNSTLRPHCSPRNEEEVAKQLKRLQLVQESLLVFNRNMIAEIAPTLEHTRDVEAAVYLARLQHSTDRLAGINDKLEALAWGTFTLDGQHDDALECVKETYSVIGKLERILYGRDENAPLTPFVAEEMKRQYRRKNESGNTNQSKEEPQNEAGYHITTTTSAITLGIPVIGHRPQESSSMATSLAPIIPYASIDHHSDEMWLEMRQATPQASRTRDAVILETPHEQRRASQKESPQSTSTSSSPEENTLDDWLASEGVTGEDHTTTERIHVDLKHNAKGSILSTAGKRTDKNSLTSTTPWTINEATKRVGKSKEPRGLSRTPTVILVRTPTVRKTERMSCRGSNHVLRYECKTSKQHLKSAHALNYDKKYGCDSSPDAVIVEKLRPKVRRKAKSRRKGRPKNQKKE